MNDNQFSQLNKTINSNNTVQIYKGTGTLTLSFDANTSQSKMKISDPYHLVLGYTRTMMGFLLFDSYPGQITMIGLGGGSLPKYCYRHLPRSQITVLEIRKDIIALRDQFHIPSNDERFRVICKDGAEYVQQPDVLIDTLIVDGFNELGQAQELSSQSFYDYCYAAMGIDGVMVVNLFGPDPLQDMYIDRICQSFKDSVITVAAENSYNTIVFAGKGNVFKISDRQMKERVQQLNILYPIDFQRIGNAWREQYYCKPYRTVG